MEEKVIRKINIDELPKYTPWVTRLPGLEPFAKPVRNLAKIDAEYDKDKYAKLLSYYKENPDVSFADIRKEQSQREPKAMTYFSRKGELFLTSASNVYRLLDEVLVNVLAESISKSRIVVELGCGYGYNFSVLMNTFPGCVWLGGEYSKNAIELATHLFNDCKNVFVSYFNWYDATWDIFDGFEEKAVVFTRHSIEQLPQAKSVMSTFAKYKDKISTVVHLEPVYELIDKDTTLGLMRQAYTLLNDYNTDLISILKSMKVQILRVEEDLIGSNPLNPTSLVQWQFAD